VALLLLPVLAFLTLGLHGCASSQHRRPRNLGIAGGLAAVGGSVTWVVGEQRSEPGYVPAIGLAVVAAGVVAMVAAGAWIAAEVACQTDPDCEDTEECREIPAPPGGVPYKQCMPR
jgi:hypothetical protein